MLNLRGFKSPSKLGEYAESVVMTKFLGAGFSVLRPNGNSERYDFVIDNGTHFLRIQVKIAQFIDGFIKLRLSSGSGTKRNPYKYYDKSQIDYYAIYCYEIDGVYIIPVDEKPSQLRVIESKNNQKKNINYAKKYEFDRWILNFGGIRKKP